MESLKLDALNSFSIGEYEAGRTRSLADVVRTKKLNVPSVSDSWQLSQVRLTRQAEHDLERMWSVLTPKRGGWVVKILDEANQATQVKGEQMGSGHGFDFEVESGAGSPVPYKAYGVTVTDGAFVVSTLGPEEGFDRGAEHLNRVVERSSNS